MKKNILLLCVALLCLSTSIAQNYKITGTVVDSLGVPLQMANVIAYQQDKNLGAFGITNQEGKYKLEGLKQDSTYTIKVSFLGLKQIEEKVEKLQGDLVKNFMMMAGADELDAINLTYQMPVSIKGDTIVYDADSFTNGTEDKLGDVLQKLPGVEVNDDGDITVEGQVVEKVQVEGKDFFEGDSRLATKNIPADAVSKVQVLKNYNNQSQLKGLGNDQDRYVINIKLKEGKKKFWFGEATVGAGYGGQAERYLIQPKAFYYSEDFSVNILTDFNNLGTPAFTGRDYFRFIGFNRRDTRQNNASINVNAASTFSAFATNRALSIDSKFLAGNASWKVSDKLDMSAFAILSSTDTRTKVLNSNTFIDSGLVEETDDRALERNQVGLFKLGANYNPNSDLSINYDGRFNISDQSQVTDFTSSRSGDIEDIDQLNSQKPISFNQSLNAYYTAGERHIFAFESQFLNQEEDPFYNAIRNIRDQQDPEPFNGALGLESADPYNINQERFVNTNKIDAKLDYFYVLNKTSNINFTIGSTVSQQNFSSDIFQITDTDERNELQDPSLRNDNVQYNFTDLFAAVHYKFITGKFTFTPGLTAHSFRTLDFQNDIENVIESQRLVPDLEVRYDIKSSQSLRLSYDQTVTFTDIDNYAEGIIFTNYNSLRSGNNQLEGSLNDRVSLRYNNFNMFNYTTIFGNITYTKQRDAIQSQTQLDGINQISAPINFGLPNESLNGSLSYGKEIRKIQFGVSASGSWSSRNNIINNVEQESININQTYGATARSNFQKGINFDLGYRLNFNDSDNGGFENNSTTNVYSAGIDWQLGKRWLLRGSYDLNDFSSDNGQENTFEFLDASIRYQKPSSRWQYSLIATNLLNAEVNVNNNFGQIATSTTQTFVLPRYVYFQMRFDI
ncbi:TonB-dependent receptor [Nonlabens ulvanivorans]|uniref:TonB-dependent receptor n=1 Tax=Nonlabens ulvanivorans TaxID=906888 RepID=UPI002942F078|nr:TonB-dependent receptor [Nonlabens ulvanivorans]WOI21995.1 TonB-dependent receptor [Nonlabens ulvanivorans]